MKAEIIDHACVDYIRQLARNPKMLEAIVKAAESASKEGRKQLESDRLKLSKQISKAERESLSLVDRLADPDLQGIRVIKNRLASLENNQQTLKSNITDLTLQFLDRQDLSLSVDEVRNVPTSWCS